MLERFTSPLHTVPQCTAYRDAGGIMFAGAAIPEQDSRDNFTTQDGIIPKEKYTCGVLSKKYLW